MQADLLLFLFCSVTIVAAPGPANLRVLAHALGQGRRAGLAAVLGCALGCLFHASVAIAVARVLLLISPMAFDAGRLAGVGYLMWLAVQVLRNRAAFQFEASPAPQSCGRIIARTLWDTVRSPRLALFFIVFLPQFVNPWTGHLDDQLLQLGVLFTLQTAAVLGLVAWFAPLPAALLRRRPFVGEALGWLAGLVYLFLALRIVWLA
jgi:threonine/homoserine/homoserine lactone efflux protein